MTTTENGAAPEEIETELTDKIEGAVNTISGIDELRSTSSQGVSLVIIAFTLDKNPDVAAQEVRDHINNVLPDLPKGIDEQGVDFTPNAGDEVFVQEWYCDSKGHVKMAGGYGCSIMTTKSGFYSGTATQR